VPPVATKRRTDPDETRVVLAHFHTTEDGTEHPPGTPLALPDDAARALIGAGYALPADAPAPEHPAAC